MAYSFATYAGEKDFSGFPTSFSTLVLALFNEGMTRLQVLVALVGAGADSGANRPYEAAGFTEYCQADLWEKRF